MNILHLITSLRTGGAEAMLQKIVGALRSRGYTSAVISLTDSSRIGAELSDSGIQVVNLGGAGGVLLPHQLAGLVRTVEAFQPDVIHSWMYHANVLGHAAASLRRNGGRPALITSIRACLDLRKADKLVLRGVRRLDSWLSRRADAIVFNSRRAAEQHAAYGYSMNRAVVIPNCFDTERFRRRAEEGARLRSHLGWDGMVVVGCVGRFDPYKDHNGLLNAAQIVVARHPGCRFVLVGRGCDSANRQLREWIARLGLTASVQLLGERSDIAVLQSAWDIAVSSSLSESSPNAIGEAMACETPCVVTDVGDCRFLVGDTGVVVPREDPGALGDALGRLVNLASDQRRELGERARERVVSEFAIPRIADMFSELYCRCAEVGLRGLTVEK